MLVVQTYCCISSYRKPHVVCFLSVLVIHTCVRLLGFCQSVSQVVLLFFFSGLRPILYVKPCANLINEAIQFFSQISIFSHYLEIEVCLYYVFRNLKLYICILLVFFNVKEEFFSSMANLVMVTHLRQPCSLFENIVEES